MIFVECTSGIAGQNMANVKGGTVLDSVLLPGTALGGGIGAIVGVAVNIFTGLFGSNKREKHVSSTTYGSV